MRSWNIKTDLIEKVSLSELKMMDLVFILFYFLLGFIVDHKMKKTKSDMVTGHMTKSCKSHAHVT